MRIIFSIEKLGMYNPVIQRNNLKDMNSYLHVVYVVKPPFFLCVRLRLDNTQKGILSTRLLLSPVKIYFVITNISHYS